MNLKNGYKLIYEKAADGKRTFYASKSNYPTSEDVKLASFADADYRGKVIYEHNGKFYISAGRIPAYDENGNPVDTVIESLVNVFEETGDADDEADEESEPEAPVVEKTPHAEAISTNSDSHGKLTVKGDVVTLKASGVIVPATNPNGNTYHHVGFKITAPDGIDPANVVITRPDSKTRVMANVLDGANFTNVYWKVTEEERVFTYYIDWNNDGVNDLTVVIDATKATLEAAPKTESAE